MTKSPTDKRRRAGKRIAVHFLRERCHFSWKTIGDNGSLIGTAKTSEQSFVFLVKRLGLFEKMFLRSFLKDGDPFAPRCILLKALGGGVHVMGFDRLVPISQALYAGGVWLLFSAERLASCIVDVLLAISDLASKGWLHGDISYNNIMYCKTSHRYMLIDFGAVQPIGMPGLSVSPGTNPFVDPLVQDGATKTVQSDIYSLACVIEQAIDQMVEPAYKFEPLLTNADLFARIQKVRLHLSYLKTHPSLEDALSKTELFYSSLGCHMPCSVRKDRARMRRLNKATKAMRSAASLASSGSSIPLREVEPLNEMTEATKNIE
jgi:hypothetical protein